MANQSKKGGSSRKGSQQQRRQGGQSAWKNPSEKHGKLLWYVRSVGTAPQLAEVILDRVREAAGVILSRVDGEGSRK